MAISKARYLKAKMICIEYEKQTKIKIGKIELSDLEFYFYSIGVPKIKMQMVNDDELVNLQNNLSDIDFPWRDVGVDDSGYLTVSSREMQLEKYGEQFLKALNKTFKNG
jgi:hypothetical protein